MSGKINIVITGDSTKYNQDLDAVEKKADETKKKVSLTVQNSLTAMRIVLDTAALVSVATGEKIDVAFLMMISMMTSSMMSLKSQIAVYMATPGMQPFAMLLSTMIPMLTSVLMFVKSEQMKLTAQLAAQREADLDNILDVVSYNG